MSSYEYDKFAAVTILSSYKPLLGQEHRSSFNYSMTLLDKGPKLFWSCPEGVTFDVYEDKAGYNKLLVQDVTNGEETEFFDTDNLYIANPRCTTPCEAQGILIHVESAGFAEKAHD